VDLRSRPSRTSTPSVDLPVPVAQCGLFIYSGLSRYAVPRPHAEGGPGDNNDDDDDDDDDNNTGATSRPPSDSACGGASTSSWATS